VPRPGPCDEPLERPALSLLEHLEAGNRIEVWQAVKVAAPRASERLGAAVPQDRLAVLHLADSAAVAGLSQVVCPLACGPCPGLRTGSLGSGGLVRLDGPVDPLDGALRVLDLHH
jgi:hypothetical protein